MKTHIGPLGLLNFYRMKKLAPSGFNELSMHATPKIAPKTLKTITIYNHS